MDAMEGMRAKWLSAASGSSWRTSSAGAGGEGRARCPSSRILHLRAPSVIRHGGFSPMLLWRRDTAVVPAFPRRLYVPFSAFPSAEKPEMADTTQTATELPKTAPESEISEIQNQTENGPSMAAKKTENAEVVQSQTADESLEVGRETETTEVQTQTSSEPLEANAEIEATEVKAETEDPLRTVHVKFMLQHLCKFGEKFFVVGEDPVLGCWDPLKGKPMEWSVGHQWVAEAVLPVGNEIKFKYILRALSGKIKWQPDPDRVLATWETPNTIVVAGDWENAANQKITEEEPVAIPADGVICTESEIGTAGEVAEISQEEVIANENEEDKVEVSEETPISQKGGDQLLVPGLASLSKSATEVASSEEATKEILSGASCESGEIASNVAEVNV